MTTSITTTLRKGSQGSSVKQLQATLNAWLKENNHDRTLVEDGIFGLATERMVKFFQCHHFLATDGIVGSSTQACLNRGIAGLPTLRPGSMGAIVLRLQIVLANYGIDPGPQDGMYGIKTQAAVMRFQHDYHIYDRYGNVTGEVGLGTWARLAEEPANMTCWSLR